MFHLPPPTMVFNSTDLEDLINQLPLPFVIAGDFNLHDLGITITHDLSHCMHITDIVAKAVLTGRSTVSGFDLACLALFRAPLCLRSSWCYICIKMFFCLHPSLYLLVS